MRPGGAIGALVLLLALPPCTGPRASLRAALAGAITGDAVGGQLLGDDPFPSNPAVRAGGTGVLVAVRLSAGAAAAALVELTPDGVPAPLAIAGTPSPAGPAFVDFLPPHACGGQAAFWARLAGSADAAGLFRSSDGVLATVTLSGGPAPGGGIFTALGARPTVDDAGRVLFLALTDPERPADLFAASAAGVISVLLASGTPAPGGGTITEIFWSATDCDGVERALVSVEDGSEHREALLIRSGGVWTVVLATGEPLPGGGTVAGLPLPPAVLASGETIITADLQASGEQAVLARSPHGSLQALARTGDTILPGGTLAACGPPSPLDSQRAVLRVVLDGDSAAPGSAESEGILAVDTAGGPLEMLLAAGDLGPNGETLRSLGDPVGGGAGSFALLAATDSGRGVLSRTGAGSAAWLTRAGDSLPGLGILLAGGARQARPSLDGNGRLIFVGSLAGAGPTGPALLRALPGQPPETLLFPGDAAPGGSQVSSLDGGPVALSDDLVLAVTLADAAGTRAAYLQRSSEGALATILVEGDPSPLGGTFRTLGRTLDPGAGDRLVFAGTLTDAAATAGIFVLQAGGTTATAAAAGTPAPGGGTLTAFGFAPAAAGLDGAAFLAATGGARTGTGIFLAPSTAASGEPLPSLIAIARTGDPAPGGGMLDMLFDPVATEAGGVAFRALLDDGRWAAFAWDGAGLRRVVAGGDPLPDGSSVGTVHLVAIHGTSRVAVALDVTGEPAATAIYGETSAGLELLLAAGAPLPPAGGESPEDGAAGQIAAFTWLGATDDGRLAAAVDLEGWTTGAAVIVDAADGDGDGWGDAVDCDPVDGGAFAVPPAGRGLQVRPAPGAALELTWTDLAGLAGSATVHDVLTGTLGSLEAADPFADAGCGAAGVSGSGVLLEGPAPEPGDGAWFLIRGRNGCGVGPAGQEPDRGPLAGVTCAGG